MRVLDEARHHTETLTPGIISLLEECGLAPSDIDRVVVDRGPGLYTGLRVGVTTATSLAQALGCALVSVTSLELLAWGARDAGVRGTALCAVDGRRGEVFVQTFHLGEGVEAVGEPARAMGVRTGGQRDTALADFSASEREGFGNLRQGNSCGVEQLPRDLRVTTRGQHAD